MVMTIAQRLSIIAALGRLAVLDAGRVVSHGSRAELRAKGGLGGLCRLGSGSTPRRYPSYWLFTQPLHFDTCVDRTT